MIKLNNRVLLVITCGYLYLNAMDNDHVINDQKFMPMPLCNRQGICYANAVIQSLFHIPGFVDCCNKFGVKSKYDKGFKLCWQLLHQIYNVDMKLRDQKTFLINAQPLVELVQRFNAQIFFDGDAYAFFRSLCGQLLQEAHLGPHRFYYQGRGTSGKQGLYPLFSFLDNFKKCECDDTFFPIHNDYIIPANGIIDVIPECKLMVFRVAGCDLLTREQFVVVAEGVKRILAEAWKLVTKQTSNVIVLKSFPLALIAQNTKIVKEDSDEEFYYGHTVAYVCNNGVWFMCSDYIIQKIGRFRDVINHLYNQNLGITISQLDPFGISDNEVLVPCENSMLFYAVQ